LGSVVVGVGGGGVRIPISRSIRVTSVALEIRRIDVLFVDSSVCMFGVGCFVQHWHIQFNSIYFIFLSSDPEGGCNPQDIEHVNYI
jgi:hypothetical protein